jgi:hypothetical protein
MRAVPILATLLLQFLAAASIAAQGGRLSEQAQMPRWYYSDSTWVRNTPWAGGTITDRIVVVSFRNGVTAEQRAAVYRRVNARAVYYEKAELDPPLFYMIEVAAHPEACGVKQAIKVLEQVPEIDLAAPDDHGVGTGDGQIVPATGGRQSQRTTCPEGTSLLR